MSFEPTVEGLLSLASALPLVALGAALFLVRPRSSELVYFGAFAVAWGAQIAAVSAARLTSDPDVHDLLFRLNIVFILATILFLAYFASLYPRRNALAARPWGGLLLVLLVLPGVLALVVRPELLVERTSGVGGRPVSVYGPAAVPLLVVPFYGTFAYALLVQFRAARREEAQLASRRARAVFLALAFFLGYVAVRQSLVWGFQARVTSVQSDAVVAAQGAVFLALVALLAAIAWVVVRRPARPGDVDVGMLVALGFPAAIALLEFAAQAGEPVFDSTGWWRIVAVAMVVHAIARYRLFDLDVRLRRAAVAGIPATVSILTLAVVGAVWLGRGTPLLLGTVAALGAVGSSMAWWYRGGLAARVAPADDESFLRYRRLEVYSAAMERALADGATGAERDLAPLRKRLGLSAREHDALEVAVRRALGARGVPGQAPPRAEPGATILGRYAIERLLGEGAHGRAYLARDRDGAPVVVKAVGTSLLGGRAAKLLLREAKLAGSLDHPNIIRVLDAAESPTEAFLVMEYAAGGSLHGLLQRRGTLPLEDATRVMDQVLAGLGAAHERGIVHRDVKPENVLLADDGTAKVADFGVARDATPDATAVGLTEGGAAGTLLYMSPEQVRGRPVDARSDLYAAAVLFHRLLTGSFYLRVAGRDDFQVRQLILRAPPRMPKGASPRVVAFLRRGLAKDPAKRFASAREMRKALPSA